eukprot:TRINITY_DN177_c0_g1_i11.p1 TRINITY_DN177_c0_g1~~TRINITY_DN177_c0_g1_i11.p1  ORF type:complete len:1349 (-),score=326.55 TRINITY_DN177_c0_g1_i11:2179-6225(-)
MPDKAPPRFDSRIRPTQQQESQSPNMYVINISSLNSRDWKDANILFCTHPDTTNWTSSRFAKIKVAGMNQKMARSLNRHKKGLAKRQQGKTLMSIFSVPSEDSTRPTSSPSSHSVETQPSNPLISEAVDILNSSIITLNPSSLDQEDEDDMTPAFPDMVAIFNPLRRLVDVKFVSLIQKKIIVLIIDDPGSSEDDYSSDSDNHASQPKRTESSVPSEAHFSESALDNETLKTKLEGVRNKYRVSSPLLDNLFKLFWITIIAFIVVMSTLFIYPASLRITSIDRVSTLELMAEIKAVGIQVQLFSMAQNLKVQTDSIRMLLAQNATVPSSILHPRVLSPQDALQHMVQTTQTEFFSNLLNTPVSTLERFEALVKTLQFYGTNNVSSIPQILTSAYGEYWLFDHIHPNGTLETKLVLDGLNQFLVSSQFLLRLNTTKWIQDNNLDLTTNYLWNEVNKNGGDLRLNVIVANQTTVYNKTILQYDFIWNSGFISLISILFMVGWLGFRPIVLQISIEKSATLQVLFGIPRNTLIDLRDHYQSLLNQRLNFNNQKSAGHERPMPFAKSKRTRSRRRVLHLKYSLMLLCLVIMALIILIIEGDYQSRLQFWVEKMDAAVRIRHRLNHISPEMISCHFVTGTHDQKLTSAMTSIESRLGTLVSGISPENYVVQSSVCSYVTCKSDFEKVLGKGSLPNTIRLFFKMVRETMAVGCTQDHSYSDMVNVLGAGSTNGIIDSAIGHVSQHFHEQYYVVNLEQLAWHLSVYFGSLLVILAMVWWGVRPFMSTLLEENVSSTSIVLSIPEKFLHEVKELVALMTEEGESSSMIPKGKREFDDSTLESWVQEVIEASSDDVLVENDEDVMQSWTVMQAFARFVVRMQARTQQLSPFTVVMSIVVICAAIYFPLMEWGTAPTLPQGDVPITGLRVMAFIFVSCLFPMQPLPYSVLLYVTSVYPPGLSDDPTLSNFNLGTQVAQMLQFVGLTTWFLVSGLKGRPKVSWGMVRYLAPVAIASQLLFGFTEGLAVEITDFHLMIVVTLLTGMGIVGVKLIAKQYEDGARVEPIRWVKMEHVLLMVAGLISGIQAGGCHGFTYWLLVIGSNLDYQYALNTSLFVLWVQSGTGLIPLFANGLEVETQFFVWRSWPVAMICFAVAYYVSNHLKKSGQFLVFLFSAIVGTMALVQLTGGDGNLWSFCLIFVFMGSLLAIILMVPWCLAGDVLGVTKRRVSLIKPRGIDVAVHGINVVDDVHSEDEEDFGSGVSKSVSSKAGTFGSRLTLIPSMPSIEEEWSVTHGDKGLDVVQEETEEGGGEGKDVIRVKEGETVEVVEVEEQEDVEEEPDVKDVEEGEEDVEGESHELN